MQAPYATMRDLPKYEKRADAAVAPWLKDESESSRSHAPPAAGFVACGSRSAPFATFHNAPGGYSAEDMALAAEAEREQLQRQSDSLNMPPEGEHSEGGDRTSADGRPCIDMNVVHQAPWDRNEVHYKVPHGVSRFPNGEDAPHYTSSHAPFATDPQG